MVAGLATLTVDGKKVADGRIARTIPLGVSADETSHVGDDTATVVSKAFSVPGRLNKLVVKLARQYSASRIKRNSIDKRARTN